MTSESLRLVELYRSIRGIDAEMIRAVLEGSGIRCFVQGTGDARIADNRVLVHPDDEDEARAILASLERGDLELDDDQDGA